MEIDNKKLRIVLGMLIMASGKAAAGDLMAAHIHITNAEEIIADELGLELSDISGTQIIRLFEEARDYLIEQQNNHS